MKKLLVILGLLWCGGAMALWYWSEARGSRVKFRTGTAHRDDLRVTINATGTIEPEEVVDVGVQVAGEVQSFGVDPRDRGKPISYGTPVEQGTVLARLDDSLFRARVAQARASVAKAEADVEKARSKLRQADRALERNRRIHAKGAGMIADHELDTSLADYESAKAALAVAEGDVAMAKANLEEATVNLGYTTIRSPVKGVILDRRVNIGQTVVASLNAPSLFLIAKDLSRMEIWASVNETDIGSIHPGQAVHFTVGAYPGETFHGRVSQIRLNASMSQSVVTYTVVVEVDNAGGRLLPYLTARLQFAVEERKGALLVSNAALRWRPKPEQVAPPYREEFASRSQRSRVGPDDNSTRPAATSEGTLWLIQGEFVRPLRVRTGLTDGVHSEIRGGDLRDGDEVVVGVERRDDSDDVYSILPHTQSEKSKSEKSKR